MLFRSLHHELVGEDVFAPEAFEPLGRFHHPLVEAFRAGAGTGEVCGKQFSPQSAAVAVAPAPVERARRNRIRGSCAGSAVEPYPIGRSWRHATHCSPQCAARGDRRAPVTQGRNDGGAAWLHAAGRRRGKVFLRGILTSLFTFNVPAVRRRYFDVRVRGFHCRAGPAGHLCRTALL